VMRASFQCRDFTGTTGLDLWARESNSWAFGYDSPSIAFAGSRDETYTNARKIQTTAHSRATMSGKCRATTAGLTLVPGAHRPVLAI